MKNLIENILNSLWSYVQYHSTAHSKQKRLYGPAFERTFAAFAQLSSRPRQKPVLVSVRPKNGS